MDDADRAQPDRENYLAGCVARAISRLPAGPGLAICEDCDEEIPEERRRAVPGCRRCLECQAEFEKGWR